MFDVAKLRESLARKREERKDFYRENDFPLEGGRISKSVREMVGYKRRIPVGGEELRRAIQRATISAFGKTEKY
jgi:hypothetical protein